MDEAKTDEWVRTERVLIEKLQTALKEVRRAVESAPHGKGLAVTETMVVNQGREITRSIMEEALRNVLENEHPRKDCDYPCG